MEQLYALVVKKTGLPQDQAKMAVDTVIQFLKSKLPAPIAAEVDTVLNSNVDLGGVEGMLGGMFGGKK
jgi:hypothetical protein